MSRADASTQVLWIARPGLHRERMSALFDGILVATFDGTGSDSRALLEQLDEALDQGRDGPSRTRSRLALGGPDRDPAVDRVLVDGGQLLARER